LGDLWSRIAQPGEGGRGQTCRSTGAPNHPYPPAVALRASPGGRYQQWGAAFPTVSREGGRGRTCRSTGAPNLTNSHATTFEGESHPGDQYSQPPGAAFPTVPGGGGRSRWCVYTPAPNLQAPQRRSGNQSAGGLTVQEVWLGERPVLRRVPPGGQYQQCVTAFLTEPREGGRGRTCRSTGAPNLPCSPITALRVSPGGQYQQPVAAFPNLSGEGGRGRTCRSTGAPNLPYSHAAALREFFPGGQYQQQVVAFSTLPGEGGRGPDMPKHRCPEPPTLSRCDAESFSGRPVPAAGSCLPDRAQRRRKGPDVPKHRCPEPPELSCCDV
ncbi:Phosphopantothenoylcysteine decarboxylase, partial [Nibea albiflora]